MDSFVSFEFFYADLMKNNLSLEEREKIISNNFHYSIEYARDILQSRFPLVEIKLRYRKNPCFAYFYMLEVIKKKHYYYEKVVAKSLDSFYIKYYVKNLLHTVEEKEEFYKKYDLYEYLI